MLHRFKTALLVLVCLILAIGRLRSDEPDEW